MTFVPVRRVSQTDRLAVASLALVLVALVAEVLGLVLPVPTALTDAALLAALILAGLLASFVLGPGFS